jgi:serine/threonine-protein kinase HipA
LAQGKIRNQFFILAKQAGMTKKAFNEIITLLLTQSDSIERLTHSSFLNESTKRSYWQAYQSRLKQLMKV